MIGFDSLMNESKYNLKRGQIIKYRDARGEVRRGRYVMAGSADGYIVLNVGGRYGRPAVVPVSKIIK